MVFDWLLDPILSPLLGLPPFVAILIISFVITLSITLVYKYTTDQERMRHLKKKTKEYQEKMRKLRDQPEKMMKLQKEAMGFNMELMKHSFKPTLYTLIPIILIFGWLNGHMAFHNLAPGEPFTLSAELQEGATGDVSLSIVPEGVSVLERENRTWRLQGEPGTYEATLTYEDGREVEKRIIISDERRYAQPEETYRDSVFTSVTLGNERIKPLGSLSLFGWQPGWLGTYIILSITLSILLRKLLRVV